jgi:hypothetical protein
VNVNERICAINSFADLADFVLALKEDLKSNPSSWENPSLERFLDSLSAWIKDMDGYYLNRHLPLPTQPSWSMFAQMLLAAKVYE